MYTSTSIHTRESIYTRVVPGKGGTSVSDIRGCGSVGNLRFTHWPCQPCESARITGNLPVVIICVYSDCYYRQPERERGEIWTGEPQRELVHVKREKDSLVGCILLKVLISITVLSIYIIIFFS